MFSTLRSRWIVIFTSLALGGFWLSPNFIKFDKDSILGKNKLILGLDIQGGSHLVMGVNVKEVIQERAARMAKDLVEQFKTDGIEISNVQSVGLEKTEIEVTVASVAAADQVVKFIEDRFSTTLQVVDTSNSRVLLKYFDATVIEMKNQVVSQAIEVIRNRIDEFGVSEPSITAQGDDRILVQLPGVQDSAGAKELINRTAKLDFRVVSGEMPLERLNDLISEAEKAGNYKLGDEGGLTYSAYVKRLNADLASKLPKNTRVVFEKLEAATTLEAGRQAFLIETDSTLGGAQLEDASVRPDEFGKPEVNFRFTVEGRRLFAELTQKAAGGFLAIVLDDVVKSAPSVREQIDSDSARITLGSRDYNSTLKEATFIATSLRAGALPAALQQLEERTVGPSLGSESIKKAELASTIGAALVIVFMFIFYRGAGLVANIALILNVFFTFAILTTIGATLTLPGVAGIALTIGMAVDANIIIFERIKEELRKGGNLAFAVKDGFNNAFSAIIDSNLTTVLTCLILMYYGTGPIRGFAVTLTIGILCSLFTAVFVSRTIIETLVIKLNLNIISIGKRA